LDRKTISKAPPPFFVVLKGAPRTDFATKKFKKKKKNDLKVFIEVQKC